MGFVEYTDLGLLYGQYVMNNLMNWNTTPATIDQSKTSAYLDTWFTALKTKGCTQINLAFAQITDIPSLNDNTGKSSAPTDVGYILKENYKIASTDVNFLQYFIQYAHNNGMQVGLSFGGEASNVANFTIPAGQETNYATQLKSFLDRYKIDTIDFDLEGQTAQTATNASLLAFFTALSPLSSMTLTVEGALSSLPLALKNNIALFRGGVNLMLYSKDSYYIDVQNDSWGLNQWLQITKNIHLGFYDSIPYENPSASASGKSYIKSGSNLTRSQAVQFIYQSVCKDLGVQLTSPFWWTDNPQLSNSIIVDPAGTTPTPIPIPIPTVWSKVALSNDGPTDIVMQPNSSYTLNSNVTLTNKSSFVVTFPASTVWKYQLLQSS